MQKRVLIEMPVEDHKWLQDTAKALNIKVKELHAGIMQRAKTGNMVKEYAQDAMRRQLEKIEAEISERDKAAALLREAIAKEKELVTAR